MSLLPEKKRTAVQALISMNKNLKEDIALVKSMIVREKVKREYMGKAQKMQKLREEEQRKRQMEMRNQIMREKQLRNQMKIKDSVYSHQNFDINQQKKAEK